MIKTVIIFSQAWPTWNQEQYLVNELPWLTKRFDRVIVVPLFKMTDTVQQIPEGVETDLSFAMKNSSPDYLWNGLSGTINHKWYNEFPNIFSGKGFFTRFFRYYKKSAIANKLIRHISKIPHNPDRTVLYSYWLNFAALAISELHGYPWKISRAHRWDIYADKLNVPYIPFQKQIINSLDQVCTVSEDGKSYLEKNYNPLPDKISVRRLGTYPPGFLNPKPDESRFHVVSCSEVVERKRLDLIIENLAEVQLHSGKTLHWTHLGDGPDMDLIRKLASAQLSNVEYNFRGHVNNSQIFELYKKTPVNLFINLSDSEGVPVTMMEAQSTGIPVFARNIDGISEIVNSKNGYLIDFNSDNIAKHLLQVVNAPVNAEKRKASFNNWDSNYNAEKNFMAFAEWLSNKIRGSESVS